MKQIFELGEVVITQGHTIVPEANGQEVTIIGPPRWSRGVHRTTREPLPMDFRYPVRWPEGHKTWQPYWMLRKRFIPPDLDTLQQQQQNSV